MDADDITSRNKEFTEALIKEAEAKRIESEKRFRAIAGELEVSRSFLNAILNVANFGLASYEPIKDNFGNITDFRIIYTNPEVPANFGLSVADVTDKLTSDVYPGIYTNGVFEMLKEAAETGNAGHYEIEVPVNGNTIWLTATIENVNDTVTVTSKNITEEKKSALQLRHMNERLASQNRDLASFTYIASHDLQEPLRKIRMFTNRIMEQEKGNFKAVSLDYFSSITATVERMQQLINDLLLYSSLDSAEWQLEKTDLNTVLKDVLLTIDDMVEEKDAVITVSDLPEVNGFPSQIRQLFSNLIGNALKYSKPDVRPNIEITAERSSGAGHFCKITITDNGIGFENQYREKIFEVFQRLHGKMEYSGTGVGLSICKKIMQNHEGYITADGHPGEGAVFSLYFPI